jgi:hypothetical protein
MKPIFFSLSLLALVGCAARPQGGMIFAQPTWGTDSKVHWGYVVNPENWDCHRATDDYGDCDICINISGKPAELSTGHILETGEWSVRREVFQADARVRLCRPVIKLLAGLFP